MKKKLILFLLAVILMIPGAGISSAGEKEIIPENLPDIEFDRQYWLEKGESAWYRFTAPAPLCYLTDMPVENIGGYPCGWEVFDNIYYDKDGNALGSIGASSDPETGGWTEFIPGETYYLKITAADTGVHYTLSAVKEYEPEALCTKEDSTESVSIELKTENTERFIPGEYNTRWSVYTVKEKFALTGENVITSSSFFLTDYRIHFENSSVSADNGRVTYSNIEKACAESTSSLKSYCKVPMIKVSDKEFIYSANHYAYILDGKGSAERPFDVWVPAGKTLLLSDEGYFFTATADMLFSDIPKVSWYTDAVLYASEGKFMKGTGEGKFSPDLVFTRAQMVQMLANIDKADLSVYKDMQSFGDAKKGQWYTPAVEWANEKGITKGIGGGKFAPDAKVSREQIAVFLCSYAKMKGASLPEGADLSAYSDNNKISSWAKQAFAEAVALGLIKGTTATTLSPEKDAARSQIAVMAQRFDINVLKPLATSTHKGSYFLEGDTCGFGTSYEIVELSGKEKPRVLYIGMASADPLEGYGAVESEYKRELGCETDYLTLEDLERGRAEEKIMNADIISVGGGDSRMLLARLCKYGTDAVIRKAAENKTVMSGSSAGAICFGVWGTSGIGDSRYQNLEATGCVDLMVCPHGLEEKRVAKVKEDLLKDPNRVALVLANSALEIKDGQYRIYADLEFTEHFGREVIGMKYWVENGELRSENLFSTDLTWRPLSELGCN